MLKPGGARLYAVLEKPLELEALPLGLTASPGNDILIPLRLANSAFPQTVRYTVTDSTGRLRPEYSGVLSARSGEAAIRFTLATNDSVGTWRIEVTHLLTGAAETGRLTVR